MRHSGCCVSNGTSHLLYFHRLEIASFRLAKCSIWQRRADSMSKGGRGRAINTDKAVLAAHLRNI